MSQYTGDYNSFHTIFGDKHVQYQLLASEAGPVSLLSVSRPGNTLAIQRIKVSVTTYSAKNLGFQDSSGMPIGLLVVPGSVTGALGNQVLELDYGPHGVTLTLGASLSLILSGAGVAGIISIDAYERKILPSNDIL